VDASVSRRLRQILEEPAFQAVVMEHYLQRVFEQGREA
jgi:hypothetical protein